MSEALLSCRGLSKKFGTFIALDNLEFSLAPNRIFCLLGLNGAGKTTLIKCLLGLLKPTSGEIFFKGRPLIPRDISESFSYLPESFQLYSEITPKQLFWALTQGLRKSFQESFQALEMVGLEDKTDKKIKTFSRGMLQRLGLAVCLVKKPQVILLDDPFLGLDILGQQDMIEVIRKLKEHDQAVLFSSHVFSQVERIADSIGVINKGTMHFCGRSDDFLKSREAASLEEAFLREIKSG